MGVNHPRVLGCMGEGGRWEWECIYAGRSCWAVDVLPLQLCSIVFLFLRFLFVFFRASST
jgi:hypothetical protein